MPDSRIPCLVPSQIRLPDPPTAYPSTACTSHIPGYKWAHINVCESLSIYISNLFHTADIKIDNEMATSGRYASIHAKPKGPGDGRPTALQIIKDYNLTSAWSDKTILITGVSSGLGVETAKALATTGATLYLTARNLDKARTALGTELTSSPKIHLLELDLMSLDSVRSCASTFLSSSPKLNVLITNAGIRNTALGQTADGFEKQFGVNHLAHFLLINLLTPTLLSSSSPEFHSRVVALSSSDHRNFPSGPINWADLNFKIEPSKYSPAKGYTQSKLANIYTTSELNRRYSTKGLTASAVHPGGIMTGLQQGENGGAIKEVLTSPKLWTRIFSMGNQLKNAEQGAATTTWAAVATELEGKGGYYLEDCQISTVVKGGEIGIDFGHGVKAFDEEGEKKLWKMSCEMVGIEDKLVE